MRKKNSKPTKTGTRGVVSGRPTNTKTRTRSRAPRTAAQYNAKPERSKQAYDRAIQVISRMRGEKLSLRQAARDVGVNPQTVLRWGRSALRKAPGGRYTAKAQDNLLRMLQIPTQDGLREIAVRGSRQASTLGEYWAAVQKYLRTGDSSVLAKFRDQQIKDASGTLVPLVTDVRALKDLARAGVLTFESLYRRGV